MLGGGGGGDNEVIDTKVDADIALDQSTLSKV